MSTGCKICDDKAAALSADRYLAQGLSYNLVARSLTLNGFKVEAQTVSRHDKHRPPSVNPDIKAGKRDAAIIIKGKVLDALETLENQEQGLGVGILAKDLQPALNTALKAQNIEDRRELKKPVVNFWIELYSQQQQQPPVLLDDPTVIDGTAVEVE